MKKTKGQSQILAELTKQTFAGGLTDLFKVELIKTACRLRNKDCVKEAQFRYSEWIVKGMRPSPELVDLILSEGVRQGGREGWEHAYTNFQKSGEKNYQLLQAMASTTQTTLIYRFNARPKILLKVIESMSRILSTQEDLEEVKAFVCSRQLENSEESLSAVFREIEENIKWRQMNEKPLSQWLYSWDKNRRQTLR
ncbi:hypothetical protein KIN20_027436 [Parelaphostrongylus tenuis]|uniref:ERAP1-like C-terminal domain-containing protein n=1 Tax=Parelaphostrongylus tenuis TaxID=148309 RepID=A0AAD5QZF5_PARTN|nr:hypothetical protein KIN20_027436 [Parelaphostrongylus tenuis]